MPLTMRAAALEDVKILTSTVHGDERGYFYESFRADEFDTLIGRRVRFVQDNISHSRRGVLRGLHAQLRPFAQAKLVRCIQGAIWDVAVDIRPHSPTFGRWCAVDLSAHNARMVWIPEGFAHGFVVLSESADVHYKTTELWHPECECSVRWDDPDIAIAWPVSASDVVLSEKDALAARLRDLALEQ